MDKLDWFKREQERKNKKEHVKQIEHRKWKTMLTRSVITLSIII